MLSPVGNFHSWILFIQKREIYEHVSACTCVFVCIHCTVEQSYSNSPTVVIPEEILSSVFTICVFHVFMCPVAC